MKGVIFTENIDKIMGGTKTQTRRVIKPQPDNDVCFCEQHKRFHPIGGGLCECVDCSCRIEPRYTEGEIVYLKETWAHIYADTTVCGGAYALENRYIYKADSNETPERWHSPIHMPMSAARIFLRITGVRAECLQDISPQDCHAEGLMNNVCADCLEIGGDCRPQRDVDMFCGNDEKIVEQYADLWDALDAKRNGGKYAWDKNPWVWVYTFALAEKPHDCPDAT